MGSEHLSLRGSFSKAGGPKGSNSAAQVLPRGRIAHGGSLFFPSSQNSP